MEQRNRRSTEVAVGRGRRARDLLARNAYVPTVDLAPDRDTTKLRHRAPSGDVPAAWTLMAMRGLRWD